MNEVAAASPPRNGEGDQPKAGGGVPHVLRQPIKQVRRARGLRKEMSLPEVVLWIQLQKRPGGFKFRKQVPQHPYTLDFACLSSRLIIEVDGEAHDRRDRPRGDEMRDRAIKERGFRTLRLPVFEVLDNMDGCVAAIVGLCGEGGPPPPRPPRDEQVRIAPRSEAMSGGHGDLLIPPRAGEDL